MERAAYVPLRYIDISLQDTHYGSSIRFRADVVHQSIDNKHLSGELPTVLFVPRPDLQGSFNDLEGNFRVLFV